MNKKNYCIIARLHPKEFCEEFCIILAEEDIPSVAVKISKSISCEILQDSHVVYGKAGQSIHNDSIEFYEIAVPENCVPEAMQILTFEPADAQVDKTALDTLGEQPSLPGNTMVLYDYPVPFNIEKYTDSMTNEVFFEEPNYEEDSDYEAQQMQAEDYPKTIGHDFATKASTFAKLSLLFAPLAIFALNYYCKARNQLAWMQQENQDSQDLANRLKIIRFMTIISPLVNMIVVWLIYYTD